MREGFFADRPDERPGLAVFLNAGDPPLDVLRDVIAMLDEEGVGCLELAVPFPDSVTDGPVIRASAKRALAVGITLRDTLDFISSVQSGLRRLRIALLADWAYSVRPDPLPDFLARVRESGADGLLMHGLPPRLNLAYRQGAAEAGVPIVTTCYATSSAAVMESAARNASAYVYLVAHYGRSGTTPANGYGELANTVATLRMRTLAPIAVGFGVRTRADVDALGEIGADAAVIGSAAVSQIETDLMEGRDIVAGLQQFLAPFTTITSKGV